MLVFNKRTGFWMLALVMLLFTIQGALAEDLWFDINTGSNEAWHGELSGNLDRINSECFKFNETGKYIKNVSWEMGSASQNGCPDSFVELRFQDGEPGGLITNSSSYTPSLNQWNIFGGFEEVELNNSQHYCVVLTYADGQGNKACGVVDTEPTPEHIEDYTYRSTDMGSTWSNITTSTQHVRIYIEDVSVAPSVNVTFYKTRIRNSWNVSGIVGVNVTWDDGFSNLTDSNGIASYNNATGLNTWTAKITDGFHFNISGNAIANNTVVGNMSQSEIKLFVNELFSNNSITNFSINISGTIVLNISGTNGSIFPNVNNYTALVIDNAGEEIFHVTSNTFEVLAFDNKTETINVHQHHINVTAKDIQSNETILVFNVTVNASNGLNTTYSTHNGFIIINTTHATHTLNITFAQGYAYLSVNETEFANTTAGIDQNVTFFLYIERSVLFRFFSTEAPTTLLNATNLTLNLKYIPTQEVTQYNVSGNGTIFVSNLTAGNWQAIYSANGFNPNEKFFTITASSTSTIDLFLSPSTINQWSIRVADNNDVDISSATIRFQRQFLDLGGQFITVEECETNQDGECDVFVDEQSDIIYRFIVIISGDTVLTTTPSNIWVLEGETRRITLRVEIGDTNLEEIESSLDLFGDMTWNNDTKIVEYSYVDGQNAITEGCLKIRRRSLTQSSWVTLSEDCVALSSADISKNISSYIINNSVVQMIGLVRYTNHDVVLEELSVYGEANIGLFAPRFNDNDGLLFSAFAVGGISLVVVLIPNFILQLVITLGVLMLIIIGGWTKLQISIVVGFLVLGIVLAYNNKTTRGQNG